MATSKSLNPEFKAVITMAKSLQKALSRESGRSTKIGIHITETGGVTASPCIFIIKGDTAAEAYGVAKGLEKQGCNCQSSGETEVTCTCPD